MSFKFYQAVKNQERYHLRGVSAGKEEVHAAIKNQDKGLFPNAFCKILPDIVAKNDAYCNIMHADTAGTKGSLAYIYWKETGDLSVWEGIAQDALVMNLDDMACVGCVDDIVISSTIGRNKNLISGDVIKTIIESAVRFKETMAEHDINLHLSGGETADVGDIVRTIDVGYTTFARLARKDLVINNITPGNVIVGLSSAGQATYENSYNGGMGSNGLTSARHDVFSHAYYNKYPESYDPMMPEELAYAGNQLLTDSININGNDIHIGKLVLSPTRTYLPFLKKLLRFDKSAIHGIIHCTGGAQTKVLHFVDQVHIVKDNLFEIPPLFDLIQKESGTSMHEMFKVFNMGHRLEIYCDSHIANDIINLSQSFNIEAQIIGHVEEGESHSLTIKHNDKEYQY